MKEPPGIKQLIEIIDKRIGGKRRKRSEDP